MVKAFFIQIIDLGTWVIIWITWNKQFSGVKPFLEPGVELPCQVFAMVLHRAKEKANNISHSANALSHCSFFLGNVFLCVNL